MAPRESQFNGGDIMKSNGNYLTKSTLCALVVCCLIFSGTSEVKADPGEVLNVKSWNRRNWITLIIILLIVLLLLLAGSQPVIF